MIDPEKQVDEATVIIEMLLRGLHGHDDHSFDTLVLEFLRSLPKPEEE